MLRTRTRAGRPDPHRADCDLLTPREPPSTAGDSARYGIGARGGRQTPRAPHRQRPHRARDNLSCPECQAAVEGGLEGCQRLFDEFTLGLTPGPQIPYTVRRLAVDCYCLQHPDRYCVSAKSLAAHLTGVCWALEFGGGEAGLQALQAWLNGIVPLTKPSIPEARGAITALDVAGATSPREAVESWARSIWEAYSHLHPVAREWVTQATGRAFM